MRVVLLRDVEVQGKPYKAGDDISGIDKGAIDSMIGMEWAEVREGKAQPAPEPISEPKAEEIVKAQEPVVLPQEPKPPTQQRKRKR
jgi:hypothetical protein